MQQMNLLPKISFYVKNAMFGIFRKNRLIDYFFQVTLVTICVLASSTAYEKSEIISAKIETCRGCSLNRLPEVKKFVMEDAPFFDRVEVKFINGAKPELIFLGKGDQELERLALSNLSRQECNELLLNKGFDRKSKYEEF